MIVMAVAMVNDDDGVRNCTPHPGNCTRVRTCVDCTPDPKRTLHPQMHCYVPSCKRRVHAGTIPITPHPANCTADTANTKLHFLYYISWLPIGLLFATAALPGSLAWLEACLCIERCQTELCGVRVLASLRTYVSLQPVRNAVEVLVETPRYSPVSHVLSLTYTIGIHIFGCSNRATQ